MFLERDSTVADESVEPRKLPKQARSKVTVDAMLTATAQVLTLEGYDRTTTARIAERAGVSVGSLYQYFPNKDALIAALIAHHADLQSRSFAAIVDRVIDEDVPPPQSLVMLVDGLIGRERLDTSLHHLLNQYVPLVKQTTLVTESVGKICAALERYLRHNKKLLKVEDIPLAARVMETALEALVHRSVGQEKEDFLLDRVQHESVVMLSAYLFGMRPVGDMVLTPATG